MDPSEKELFDFLKTLNIPDDYTKNYVVKCKEECITLEILLTLNDSELKELGILMGDRKLIMRVSNPVELANEVRNKKLKFSRNGNTFSSLVLKSYFVDKSLIIKSIMDLYELNNQTGKNESPISFSAPRRFGKTCILDLLESFFGGYSPIETFNGLLIKEHENVFQWYGKYMVIYVTFGCGRDLVETRDDCVASCRMILHHTFRTYAYVLNDLNPADFSAFESWVNEDDYKLKTDDDVLRGLRFLIECVASYEKKDICLLIDEFDKIYASAIYKATGNNLREIVNFYTEMVAKVVKFDPITSISVFCGITPITCQAHYSLNNPVCIEFLSHDNFCNFFGITEPEFEDVMGRPNIPLKVKQLKKSALEWYDGYVYEQTKILNIYSFVNFIIQQKVLSFWKKSGVASGLWEAVHKSSIRAEIYKLWSGMSLEIKIVDLKPEDLCLLPNGRYELTNFDLIFTFLLQQGYLAKVKNLENGKILVKVPNEEMKTVYSGTLEKYYVKMFNFDPEKIEELYSLFDQMNFSAMNNIKMKLKKFKTGLTELLNNETRVVNEAWFEAFLFAIFFQNSEVKLQIKVEKTAKIIDLLVKMNSTYFLIEETMITDGKGALEKLLRKKYYKKIEENSQFMLIGIGVNNSNGEFNVSISCLVNSTDGNFINV